MKKLLGILSILILIMIYVIVGVRETYVYAASNTTTRSSTTSKKSSSTSSSKKSSSTSSSKKSSSTSSSKKSSSTSSSKKSSSTSSSKKSSSSTTSCSHTYNVTSATCVTAKVCTKCGYTAQKALGHSYSATWKHDSTNHWLECSTCGFTASKSQHSGGTNTCEAGAKCSTCGVTYGKALGHKHAYEYSSSTNHSVYCGRCGARFGTGTHSFSNATCTASKECSLCGYVAQKALGHDYGAATCTKAKTCTRCGATTGSALGHDYGAATCTKAKTCTRCGATTGSALGHDYTSKTTTDTYLKSAATCTTKAVYYYKCSRCTAKGTNTYEVGNLLGHDYTNKTTTDTYLKSAATCTTKAVYYYKCSRCTAKGTNTYEVGNLLGHDYTSKTTTDTYLKSAATCTTKAVYYYKCSRCTAKGTNTYEAGNPLGHDYTSKTTTDTYLKSAATCTTKAVYYYKCSRCTAKGTNTYEAGNPLGHDYTSKTTTDTYLKSAATCTTKAVYYYKCSRCTAKGTNTYEAGNPLGHDYTSKTTTDTYLKSAATCTTKAVYYYKCSRCTAKGTNTYEAGNPLGHDYTSKTTTDTYLKSAATCTTKAVYYYKCSRCDVKGNETYESGKVLGHDFTVQSVTPIYLKSAATCTTKAVYYYKCSRCSESSKGNTNATYEWGEALGHDFAEQSPTQVYLKNAATCTTKAEYYYKCIRCDRSSKGTTNTTYEYGDVLGHSIPPKFSYDDNYHWKVCDRSCCSGKNIYVYEKEQHYGGVATTTTRKKCEACGAEYGDLLSEKYTADKEIANIPILLDGMTPIKWASENQKNVWVETKEEDIGWYNYNSNEKQFANVRLKDGSIYVWIPRFTYKVNNSDLVDYSWSKGTVDREGFSKLEAFSYGGNELTGIWIAKFLMSEENGIIMSKFNKNIDKSKTISEAYLASKDMMYYNFSKYGVNDMAESHLLKNSEFAAVSYLTLVEHDSNSSTSGNTVPWNNNSNITGYVGSSKDSNGGESFEYSSIEGWNGSTTHNVYGIYDMSGIYEFVSVYLYGGNIANGEYLGYVEEEIDVDKYLESYSDFSLGKDSDYIGGLTKDTPFMARGGNYIDAEKSGIFGYKGINGEAGCGYRNVIIPINLYKEHENRVYALESKETVAEGGKIIVEANLNVKEGHDCTLSKEDLLDSLNITFTQTSEDKVFITKGLNAEILYVNDENINGNIKLLVGNNKIGLRLGGIINKEPVFKVAENSVGRISIYSNEDINLNTLELEVVKSPEVNYEKSKIKEISVIENPTDIVTGKDLTGGKMKVLRENGVEEIVDMLCNEVLSSIEGNKVKLTYDGTTTSFNLLGDSNKVYIKVNNATGTGIYTKGEHIILDGSSINGKKFSKWNGIEGAEVMYYTVPQTSCEIEAEMLNVSKVEIARVPVKTEYVVNNGIDLRGGIIKVTFENGIIEYVDMICDNVYVVIGDALKCVGSKNIAVFYGDKYTTFNITVK